MVLENVEYFIFFFAINFSKHSTILNYLFCIENSFIFFHNFFSCSIKKKNRNKINSTRELYCK